MAGNGSADMMLELKNISSGYGAIEALRSVNLSIRKGEIVTLIGANGAGKSTTLRSITGLISPTAGEIVFEGRALNGMPSHRIVALGISMVPEGRAIFANLSVSENLEMGAYLQRNHDQKAKELERVFALFPRLKERRKQAGGTLSGGEQQMLAIGRALMATPRILLLDEPSMGLAPNLVELIFETILEIHRSGTAILLVEQNASQALAIADRGYVLQTGRIILADSSSGLAANEDVRRSYLGEI